LGVPFRIVPDEAPAAIFSFSKRFTGYHQDKGQKRAEGIFPDADNV